VIFLDLDILITTIVTSTAAIVAIIGGFLVSRVISLSSEQNVAESRLLDIREEYNKLYDQNQLMSLSGQGEHLIAIELKSLKEQVKKQEQIVKRNSKPAGIWSGLVVLFYACVVGIGWPSTLLPYTENMYNDDLTKKVLLIFFFSEIIIIFIYLAINMRKLTRNL
jgi:hypothetical protein